MGAPITAYNRISDCPITIHSNIYEPDYVVVVDDTYIGDNDQWHMPVYCLQAKHDNGTWIRTGDKIGQFRIMEVMPEIQFDEVESFGNCDRGGFGTTGTN